MEFKHVEDDEYQCQYYQTSAPAKIQYLSNAITFAITEFLEHTRLELTSSYPAKRTVCNSVINKVQAELLNNVSDIMEQREHDLRDLLRIPPHVLLPEDKHHSKEFSEEEVINLKDEIVELENSYIKKKTFTYLCEKELEILEQLNPLREKIDDIIMKLDNLKKPDDTKFEKLRKNHNKATKIVMEKLFSDGQQLKFEE